MRPAGHTKQPPAVALAAYAPATDWYRPAPHVKHVDAPVPFTAHEPAGHGVQPCEPPAALEYRPSAHGWHVMTAEPVGSGANNPGAHGTQELRPVPGTEPAAHASHIVAPAAEATPAPLHASHACAPSVPAKNPSAHSSQVAALPADA